MSRRAAALRHPVADPLDHELGLVAFVERGVEADRLALGAVGPEVLAEAAGVVSDQRVGRRQDVAGGAVVLLQAEQLPGKVPAELLQVLDPRAAPAVDRLVVVADHERRAVGAGQQLRQSYWMALVSWNSSTSTCGSAGDMVQHIRVVAPQLERAQQQLGEVDGARALACSS